ncbi:hypothetical protein GX50_03317 [[Emmonsia] crescens]|uniref:Structure-specific endonuclease subunit SLX4 n=1 Tax=[Emmonsia] crescens TaxID=73230 RepID=A0A2B7ZKY8_9EURO|nr:hypothetical protein GX50_03317 [Emmonsia crescens]
MDNVVIASQSAPLPTHGRIFARSITPISVHSSPTAAEVIELSSPFSPPSPSTLLKTLSKTSSHRATNLQTDGEKTARHGVARIRPMLGNSAGKENKSVNGSRAKKKITEGPERRTGSPGNATQTEIQIVNGDRLIVSPKRREKKGATAKRTKRPDGVADKKLRGRVSKPKATGSLELEAKILPSKPCDDELPSVGNDTDEEWEWPGRGLQLEQATKRRLDWTPTKDTAIPVVDLAEINSPPCGEGLTRVHGAGTLFSNYGFSGVLETSLGSKLEDSHSAPTTKRPMELQNFYNTTGIPTPTESRQSPATDDSQSTLPKQQRVKVKKPQKAKLTTITSYATAKYNVADETVDLDHIKILAPNKPKKKSTAKRPLGTKRANPGRRKSNTLKNENEPPVFKVVPPLEAFKSFEGQELLFGTSSQLEHGDLEYQLKEIQDTANPPNNPNAASGQVIPYKTSSETNLGSSLFGLSGSKNLWSASARDLTGAVLEVDEVDLSEPSMAISASKAKSRCKPDNRDPPVRNVAHVENVPHTTTANICSPLMANGNEPSLEDDAVYRKKVEPTSVNSNSNPHSSTSDTRLERTLHDKPVFAGFTTSELAKKVAAYGFKPIKSRDKMISLLEKCWETQTMSSNLAPKPNPRDDETQSNAFLKEAPSGLEGRPGSISRTSTQLPNKKRSAKNSTKPQELTSFSFSNGGSTTTPKLPTKRSVSPCTILIDDDQLSDSVGEAVLLSPSHDSHGNSTSRTQRNVLEIYAPTTPMAIRSGKTSGSVTSSINLPSLPSQITEAIKSQPRTRVFNGLKQPTWYEKILMYDPIQLEDLAVWLNTDGFGRIGEDREVGPGVVREWCESKGVCCVWKKQTSVRSHCPPVAF